MAELIDFKYTSTGRTGVFEEDGETYIKSIFNDAAVLEGIKKARNEEKLANAKCSLHDNEDVRFWTRWPSVEQKNIFDRKYPDIADALEAREEEIRNKAYLKLYRLHPEIFLVYRP